MTAATQVRSLFHLAYHVRNLNTARSFYRDILGCEEGRSTDTWVDFNFFGHQISLHLGEPFATTNTGKVGNHMVPMPHLGAILELPDWEALAGRLKKADTQFVIEPQVRFEGQPGEQWTMFFRDPCGIPAANGHTSSRQWSVHRPSSWRFLAAISLISPVPMWIASSTLCSATS